MASTIKRQLCATCHQAKGVAACNGCQQMFCLNHFVEHRDDLSKLMDTISIEHDTLRNDFDQDQAQQIYRTRIDQWEKESIEQIQNVAKKLRIQLQELFDSKREEFKIPIDNLASELQASRISDDYTENDIERWTTKLQTLKEELKIWSIVRIEEDKDAENTIRFLKIYDLHQQPSQPMTPQSDSKIDISEQISLINDKFTNCNSDIVLSQNDSIALCSAKRKMNTTRYIYGVNHYLTGKHTIHLVVDSKGELPLFFGVITATKKYCQSYFNSNNSSIFGWFNMETQVICGKSYSNSEESTLQTGDELLLTVDCDEQQICLENQRAKRSSQILVKMDKCPFPWKIMIGLSNPNDCIRIVD